MRSQRLWSALVLGCTLALSAGWTPADDAAKPTPASDTERIVGVWQITSLEVDGDRVPEDDARKLSIVNEKGGVWTLKSDDQTEPICVGKSTFAPDKFPKEIDFAATEGAEAGVKYHGIYELEQNTRRLCFTPADYPRPTEFTSFPGTKRYLLTLQRVPTK